MLFIRLGLSVGLLNSFLPSLVAFFCVFFRNGHPLSGLFPEFLRPSAGVAFFARVRFLIQFMEVNPFIVFAQSKDGSWHIMRVKEDLDLLGIGGLTEFFRQLIKPTVLLNRTASDSPCFGMKERILQSCF